MDVIRGVHHLTMSVGGAQEDYDFHTKVLGLKSVKKTVLFDGVLPIYHLYYGNDQGDVSTLLTSFPFRQAGIMGRRGTNQTKVLNLAVPAGSLDFWTERLERHGVGFRRAELFGAERLHLTHPCGIEYGLVADAGPDERRPWEGGGVPGDAAIRGAYGITISVRDAGEMREFLENGLGARHLDSDGGRERFEVGQGGHGRNLELVAEPDLPPGTWRFGEGTVHHVAYDVGDAESQKRAKDWLEGLGYTDCSDVKDRQYFYSVYVRSPSGALLELAYSKPESFTIDEAPDRLGSHFMIPPQFEQRREEIMSTLEPIATDGTA